MLEKNKKNIFIILTIMSFILIYAGHFLFAPDSVRKTESISRNEKAEEQPGSIKPPVEYRKISMKLQGNKQEVRIIEVDLKSGRAEIKPVLSHDSIFGFEKLSSIVKRSNAYAAINAGFFTEYGQPGGMVAIDGKLLTKATGKFPVFIIEDNSARFEETKMSIALKINQKEIQINDINALSPIPGQVVAYTPEYGADTRLKGRNISVIINDKTVQDIAEYNGICPIPRNGMVLSFITPGKYRIDNLPISKGDNIELKTNPEISSGYQAYECGSWIVRDGKVVIGEKDEWVGLLTNPDPRTAIGIKENGKVVLITVDGRQPGYSTGVSGKILGEILLQLGVRDAAMLDGGASTEMIVEGKIVNKPSHRGEERLLGGAITVRIK